MRAMRLALVWLISIGCGSSATPVRDPVKPVDPPPANPVAPSSELSKALEPLQWWLGDWDADDGIEHWTAASGAIYGVAFRNNGTFEVMIVDDGEGTGKPDGELRFIAMPNGKRAVEFRHGVVTGTSAKFTNDSQMFPNMIEYGLAGDAMTAKVAGGDRAEEFHFRHGKPASAPELEAADRAFSDDTGKRGVDGWVAAFDAGGAMMRRGERVEGAAIGETMKNLLSTGRLAWAPIASARSGQLGFTVGKATYTGAKKEDSWRSTYVTMWRRQPDGAWKVLFDTGRSVQESE
jgi:ketosteroid isomerase-like protein